MAWGLWHGRLTLALEPSELTALHLKINAINAWVGANRTTNPLFHYGFDGVRAAIDQLVTAVQALISQPALGLPIPVLGWLVARIAPGDEPRAEVIDAPDSQFTGRTSRRTPCS